VRQEVVQRKQAHVPGHLRAVFFRTGFRAYGEK
jgi:hypothetical protein